MREIMSAAELGNSLPLWSCIPFVGMLLSIAIIPLIRPEWWEKKKLWVVLFWSLLFLIPFAVAYGLGTASERFLESIIGDYLTFIVLLFGLFCVTGNISLEGDIKGTPLTNTILLLLSALLSSWIGTTGASMLMIRPIIRANKYRPHKTQIAVFFIFLVSNIGGCLTPIGDPPLLMGFIRGVPFFWSLSLLPVMLMNFGILLIAFFIIDTIFYNKDKQLGMSYNIVKEDKKPIRLRGAHNIIYLVMIVVAVVLSGILPTMPAFQNAEGEVIGLHILGEVSLTVPAMIEIVIILIAAALSLITTKKEVREANHFSWDAIQEVAVLFVGIFVTMIPALLILKAKGGELGLTEPWQMFWATGALSSFLDNTPTYLVFMTTAGSLGASTGVSTIVGTISQQMLMAISCGAVFMGANTYIGNAPNLMVKSIAEENGMKMPSFFGYMGWSLSCLIPVFIIDMLVFFL
ncbi:MAG: sodium:proton antiporter [Clostridium sp.]|nr:sodium:proton antiporter [Clostridium sp.]